MSPTGSHSAATPGARRGGRARGRAMGTRRAARPSHAAPRLRRAAPRLRRAAPPTQIRTAAEPDALPDSSQPRVRTPEPSSPPQDAASTATHRDTDEHHQDPLRLHTKLLSGVRRFPQRPKPMSSAPPRRAHERCARPTTPTGASTATQEARSRSVPRGASRPSGSARRARPRRAGSSCARSRRRASCGLDSTSAVSHAKVGTPAHETGHDEHACRPVRGRARHRDREHHARQPPPPPGGRATTSRAS